MHNCKGVCHYNLQQVSIEKTVELICPQCGKNWMAQINRQKRICCGKLVVKFSSIEKNVAVKPTVINETVRS